MGTRATIPWAVNRARYPACQTCGGKGMIPADTSLRSGIVVNGHFGCPTCKSHGVILPPLPEEREWPVE